MTHRREFLTGVAGLALAAPLAGGAVAQPSGQPADILLVNGRIATLNPAQPRAEAVLVRGGRIAFVGSNAEARQRARGLAPVDLGGRTLMPGFIDGHTHFEWYIESDVFHTRIDRSHKTLPEIFAVLRQAAATKPKGEWIFGRGYFSLDQQVAEKRLATREELDAISTDHPIILFSSIHVSSLNTPALKKLGMWTLEDEKKLRWKDGSPRTATLIHRDANGVPNGVVTEMFDMVLDQPLIPEADRLPAYSRYAREKFLGAGMTSVCNVSGDPDHIRMEKALQARGQLPLRFRSFYQLLAVVGLDDLIAAGLTQGQGTDMHKVGGVKMFVDGAGQDGMGHRITDYKWTEERLIDTLAKCNMANLPALLHAVTPGGLNRALNAIAGAKARTGRNLRHQIHHLGFLDGTSPDLHRIRELGVTVGMTRAEKGNGTPRPRPDFRAMVDAGLQVMSVADPAGSFPGFSAWEGVGSLVAPASEGGTLMDGRHLTVDEAIRTWTTQSALTNYEEANKGQVSVGKLADFQVLSADPWAIPPGALFDIKVEETYLGGRSVYRRT
ncbi:amidohydrolase [Phenylobacterium sp.]|jgi:predicted amidohydrolase YtcJ|uniref:amidohydrolase n=1 Tax=Phenylobacterium sp. TaxID=1871053 RepID=UPI003783A517